MKWKLPQILSKTLRLVTQKSLFTLSSSQFLFDSLPRESPYEIWGLSISWYYLHSLKVCYTFGELNNF